MISRWTFASSATNEYVMTSVRIGDTPDILFVEQDYFIVPELRRAMERLGVTHRRIAFRQSQDFLKELFEAIAARRPDFILTVNHAGLDGEGQVLELLRGRGVPLASWFVDRHEMYMRGPVSPDALLAVFSWDPEAARAIGRTGVAYAGYLPLGTDPECFRRGDDVPGKTGVGFVGSSWTGKVADVLKAGRYCADLLRGFKPLAEKWLLSPGAPVFRVLRSEKSLYDVWKRLSDEERTLYLRLVQMEATRKHRITAIRELLPFRPVVVGDAYWRKSLAGRGEYEWKPRLSYRDELPGFYGSNAVNFNVTSLQSYASVNQRVYDVPACGGFLLTDAGETLEGLFDPESEVACYDRSEDIGPQVARWLEDPAGRRGVVEAARRRILAEHTYEHRLAEIVSVMRKVF